MRSYPRWPTGGGACGALLLAVLALGSLARAEGPESAEPSLGDLEALLSESVVTTASRSAERSSVAPSTVMSITADEIQSGGMRSLDEVLEFLGLGIYVAKPRDYTTGIDVGAQGVMFRDGGRHILVLLDGVILNSQGTGRISIHEALGVPLELIDHVEVMLGPGSVVYGSNAMLAVINVVTKRARELHGIHARVDVGSSAAQDEQGALTYAAGTRPGLRYRLSLGSGGKFRLGGTEGEATAMAEFAQEQSSTYGVSEFSPGPEGNQSFLPDQISWGGAAGHRMRAASAVVTARLGNFRLLVNGFDYSRNMPLVGTFNDARSIEAQTGARLDLNHQWEIDSRFTLESRLYGGYAQFAESSSYGESFWCVAGQDNGCQMEISARSGWVGLEQKLAANWRSDSRVVTSIGYDLRPVFFDTTPADYLDLVTGEAPTGMALPHTRTNTFLGALFAQQVWRPLDWLSLNLGGRFDLEKRFGQRLSPRAAVVFSPTRSTSVRVSYNEAFRAPSLFETTEFDPTYRITPRGLRPETVRSGELELRQVISRLTVSLRGYYTDYQNLIESRDATPDELAAFAEQLSSTVDPSMVLVNDNLTSLDVLGGSLRAQLPLPAGFQLGGSFTLTRTRSADGLVPPNLPRGFGNYRVGWRSSEEGYSVSLNGMVGGSRAVLSNTEPTDLSIGPRVDHRLSASGPLWRAQSLRWHATVGFNLNPELPYVIATETDSEKGYVLYPEQPRAFGFVGVQYRLDAFGAGQARQP